MPNGDPRDGFFYLILTLMIEVIILPMASSNVIMWNCHLACAGASGSFYLPRDAKRRSSGRIFLSYPKTHEIFLYSVTLHQMMAAELSLVSAEPFNYLKTSVLSGERLKVDVTSPALRLLLIHWRSTHYAGYARA